MEAAENEWKGMQGNASEVQRNGGQWKVMHVHSGASNFMQVSATECQENTNDCVCMRSDASE